MLWSFKNIEQNIYHSFLSKIVILKKHHIQMTSKLLQKKKKKDKKNVNGSPFSSQQNFKGLIGQKNSIIVIIIYNKISKTFYMMSRKTNIKQLLHSPEVTLSDQYYNKCNAYIIINSTKNDLK
jgi:hypothetical protein